MLICETCRSGEASSQATDEAGLGYSFSFPFKSGLRTLVMMPDSVDSALTGIRVSAWSINRTSDGLKLINDHDAGDRMIYDFAGAALYHVRSTDRLGRMGGDEFLLVCPNSTMAERSLAWLAHRAAAVNLGLTHRDGRQLATR